MPQTILPEKIDNYYYKCLSRMKNGNESLTVKEESDFTIDERTFYNFGDDIVFEWLFCIIYTTLFYITLYFQIRMKVIEI